MPTIEALAPTYSTTGFSVHFSKYASHEDGGFGVPVELIAGEATERIFSDLRETASREGFRMFERDGLRVGVVDALAERDLARQTFGLYERLLRAAGGDRLVRVWNYVPRINERGPDGLENYRAFCAGRSMAFERCFGDGFRAVLPAASAVGCADGRLALVFVATRSQPRHLENPAQVPAYAYPAEHGPRAPSFCRATQVEVGGEKYVFISGTASIKGHVSISREHLGGQLACTLDNLRIISHRCGLGLRLGADREREWRRHFKVYLRRAEDYAIVSRELNERLFDRNDHVTWLRADICRRELLVEIEASLVGPAGEV